MSSVTIKRAEVPISEFIIDGMSKNQVRRKRIEEARRKEHEDFSAKNQRRRGIREAKRERDRDDEDAMQQVIESTRDSPPDADDARRRRPAEHLDDKQGGLLEAKLADRHQPMIDGKEFESDPDDKSISSTTPYFFYCLYLVYIDTKDSFQYLDTDTFYHLRYIRVFEYHNR